MISEMFVDLHVGALNEPLSGRRWDLQTITRELYKRTIYHQGQGMKSTDRVFLLYGNRLEFFVDLLAIWNLGGCAVPIDPRLTPFEVETLARAARPRLALRHGASGESVAGCLAGLGVKVLDSAEVFEDSAPTEAPTMSGHDPSLDQEALILFTSGSTGQPKGVVHTHRSLRARWFALRQCLGLEKFRRTLCLLPTHFGHGLICNCLFPWLCGHDLFVLPSFQPDIVMQLGTLVDEFEITFMSSVPAVWRLALKTAKAPRSPNLERVFCGSAPLTASLWKQIREWTGTKEVFNAYGITETGSWLAGTTIADFVPEDGLIGEMWGGILKVLKSARTSGPPSLMPECAPGEPGYIWVNTPALMKGYLGRDDLTAQVVSQGWFLTGDIGFLDDRGCLYLRGREREEINKGGMKVYPGDVDAVVERFEGATDVCTFGYDDLHYGQNVGLAVVLNDRKEETIRDLYDWLKRHLGEFQMPVRWYVVDAIPRTSRGKVSRAKVAEECSHLAPVDMRKVLSGR